MLDFVATCVLDSALVCLVMLVLYVTSLVLIEVFIAIIDWMVRRGGKKGQSTDDPSCLKIPTDCPKTDYDFIVDLECPDGAIVRVAIPIDPNSWEGRGSRICDEDISPVGLNLVCSGHYT